MSSRSSQLTPLSSNLNAQMDSHQIYGAVKARYSAASLSPDHLTRGYGSAVAQAFGYSEDELASIPTESNLGLSCGNPLAMASLREGETVIDLGSGAGFDAFLAAKKVGPTGRIIGVDMNKDMLVLAERNKAKSGASNVRFVEAQITRIPLEDCTADVIISNCVVNLVPEAEKQRVFDEMARLLKPGGRAAVSDILARKPLPENLRRSIAAYVGCVAGASLVEQYKSYLERAGFTDILIQDAGVDLNVYTHTMPDGTKRARNEGAAAINCCAPEPTAGCGTSDKRLRQESCDGLDLQTLAAELGGADLNEWVGSFKIYAAKR